MFGAPIAGLTWFAWTSLSPETRQETDNAYVQSARLAIASSLAGRIVEVRVRENQAVKAGDVLVVLDRAPLEADVAQAEAALGLAYGRVATLREEYRARWLAAQSAQERLTFAVGELARARQLGEEGLASQQQVETAEQAERQAQADLAAARQAVAVARANGGDPGLPLDRHPVLLEANARLDRARLALSYAEIRAPTDGTATRVEQVQTGSFVNPGQSLFWLVSGTPWIEANFKEDQITAMREGQTARVRIDALGDTSFEARVASFAPGTGAVFSALPPQNATGNWVKVVQRVPVRLEFVDAPEDRRLSAGLSAHVSVDTPQAR
jgi:membrane fusion protein (multidrug efflux system)